MKKLYYNNFTTLWRISKRKSDSVFITKTASHDDMGIGDRCWRRNVLVTVWSFLQTLKNITIGWLTNIEIQSPTITICNLQIVTNIDVTHPTDWSPRTAVCVKSVIFCASYDRLPKTKIRHLSSVGDSTWVTSTLFIRTSWFHRIFETEARTFTRIFGLLLPLFIKGNFRIQW